MRLGAAKRTDRIHIRESGPVEKMRLEPIQRNQANSRLARDKRMRSHVEEKSEWLNRRLLAPLAYGCCVASMYGRHSRFAPHFSLHRGNRLLTETPAAAFCRPISPTRSAWPSAQRSWSRK